DISIQRECSKSMSSRRREVVQQGHESLTRSRRASPLFDARSVHVVPEHGKMGRTPLAAFFNIPMEEMNGYGREPDNLTGLGDSSKALSNMGVLRFD
ncbi:MAG: hypothetical protein V3T42_01645, partial [Nitrospirales bacterium]